MPEVDLSLVLACYKEEKIFTDSVARIIEALENMRCRYEIIFVDDGSPDGTRPLIDDALKRHPDKPLKKIFHPENRGRGAAVTTGFLAAAGAVLGYIDIDLEVGPQYILPCWLAVRRGADVAIARRIYTFGWRSLLRNVLSRGYSALVRASLGIPNWDTESGYKFFRREPLLALLKEPRDPGWFWDTEIMALAHKKGLRVVEVPCLFLRRLDKTSTVRPLRDTLVYLRRLWAFRP